MLCYDLISNSSGVQYFNFYSHYRQVWICLAISLVAVGSLLTWLTVYNSNKAMNFEDFVQNNMYLWSHLTKNSKLTLTSYIHILNKDLKFNISYFKIVGFYTALRNRASYVIVGIWCLMTVVLANAYAGTLYSVLTVTKLEPVINSLEKLAYTGNVQLLIQARSELTERILVEMYISLKIVGLNFKPLN